MHVSRLPLLPWLLLAARWTTGATLARAFCSQFHAKSAFLSGNGRIRGRSCDRASSSVVEFRPAVSRSPGSSARPRASSSSATFLRMLLQKQPGESDAAFMKRIQQLASDPKAFESAVLPHRGQGQQAPTALRHSPGRDGFGTNSTDGPSPPSSSEAPAPGRRGGYQRAEDWDREQREQAKGLSWEERVQFDGRRHGNRFQQNEILRHHLKTY